MDIKSLFEGLMMNINENQDEDDSGKIPSNILLTLEELFKDDLVSALNFVESENVTKFVSPGGRTVFQCIGVNGIYTCYAGAYFCSCPGFGHRVIGRNDGFICKHIFAVKLAIALKKFKIKEETNEKISQILIGDVNEDGNEEDDSQDAIQEDLLYLQV